MPTTDPNADDESLGAYAETLIDGLVEHVPGWVERLLVDRLGDELGRCSAERLSSDVDRTIEDVTVLLRSDIDDQRANPLAVIRRLVQPITETLIEAGVERPRRDPDAVRIFPGDHFDLVPGAFGDVHQDLHMPGLMWGAAKAHVHLRRRREEGRRQ